MDRFIIRKKKEGNNSKSSKWHNNKSTKNVNSSASITTTETVPCASTESTSISSTSTSETSTKRTVSTSVSTESTSIPSTSTSETSTKGTVSTSVSTESTSSTKRSFLQRWKVGRPWLLNNSGGMWCEYCRKYEAKIKPLLTKSKQMIDGTSSYKVETISHHERSRAHEMAESIFYNTKQVPENAPAFQMATHFSDKTKEKISFLFRNAHAIAKKNRAIDDYRWLCNLDEAKGLEPGKTYRNNFAVRQFLDAIATVERRKVASAIKDAPFFSLTSDGATDSAIIEQEVVFVRLSINGQIETKFVGLCSPVRPDAQGITEAILGCVQELDTQFNSEYLQKKIVGFGCDGASVMIGRKNGVSARLKEIQPSLLTMHCFAHRLELSYKDAVKSNDVYDKCITLLMGVYYFYHNSPKQRANLRRSFQALGVKSVVPTRVGGTRWMSHLVLAINTFLKGYKAIAIHLADILQQPKQEAQQKARGYLRLLRRSDIVAYLHLLLDVLQPLKKLSLTLQNRDTILAEVPMRLEATVAVIEGYKNGDSPLLSQFLNEPAEFKNENLTGTVTTDQFYKKKEALCEKLLKTLETRFQDVKSGLAAATRVVSFKFWPAYKDENKKLIQEFGIDEIRKLSAHFSNVLVKDDLDENIFVTEWNMMKQNLYARHRSDIHSLQWANVFQCFPNEFQSILRLVNLCLALPASSAENERGFSLMKRIKTNQRNRLLATSTSDLMAIQLLSKDVSNYDPREAVECWIQSSKACRRPYFSDEREAEEPPFKRARDESNQVEADVNQAEAAEDFSECSDFSDAGYDSEYEKSEKEVDKAVRVFAAEEL